MKKKNRIQLFIYDLYYGPKSNNYLHCVSEYIEMGVHFFVGHLYLHIYIWRRVAVIYTIIHLGTSTLRLVHELLLTRTTATIYVHDDPSGTRVVLRLNASAAPFVFGDYPRALVEIVDKMRIINIAVCCNWCVCRMVHARFEILYKDIM